MVSIADVAAQAGVSPTTVSHTLSGKRKVSPAIKARVEDAMDLLGYVPSRSAQNLALGVTRIIALVVPDIGNGFFAQLAKGAEQAAAARGYGVLICATGFDHASEVQYLEMIRARAVDGVVYTAGDPPSVSELDRALGSTPTVLVDEEIAGSDLMSVVSDNEAGGRLAALHLLSLGHRSALVLAVDGVIGARRVEGFTQAWAAGGGLTPALTMGRVTAESGRSLVEPYIEAIRRGEYSAIFASSDLMALGAIELLRENGIVVPRDVSFVGFDDSPDARYSSPRLTTIRQDVFSLGKVAITMLLDTLEGRGTDGVVHSVIPVQLIERESAAPYQDRFSGKEA